MKARYVVMASVLSGAALGVAMTWADFRHSPPQMFPGLVPETGVQTGVPKVVVDKLDHDFGYVEQRGSVKHAFRFTNAGTGTLTLKAGVTTCAACTIAELKKTRVAAGESTEVVVEYSASGGKPDFRQTAFVLTNDPKQPRVELNIRGKVTARYRIDPQQLVFSRVSASEPATAEFRVYCFVSEALRIFDPEFTVSQTAKFFEARIEPIPPEELVGLKAKSGSRVLVTVKPGLPLGPFRQTIRVALATDESAEPTPTEVSIEGNVVSSLTLVGPGWSSKSGVLTVGNVKAAEGATRRLTVLVRGEARESVAIEPGTLNPPWMKVTVGKSSKLNEAVNQIPLTVEIPPGRPPAIYLGNDQGKFGEIVLEVKNQPDVKQIRLHVKFVIDNAN